MAIKRIQIGGTNIDVHDARIEAIDSELSSSSSNPVENSAIASEFGRVDSVLGNQASVIDQLYSQVNSLSRDTAIIAWDGVSTPDVTQIPSGVSVEYNGTTYTGTLQASASTTGKTYYISEGSGDSMRRYITVDGSNIDGSDYVWFDYGSTAIDLSDYERKDDNIWLTEEQFNALTYKDPSKTYNVYEEVEEL